MNKDELINELIAAGAKPSEASELAQFEKSLNKPLLQRSHGFKLTQVKKVLERLNKSHRLSWRRFIRPLGLAISGLSVAGASVFASQGSLPGEPLYPIKRLSETVFEQINPEFKNEIPIRRSEEVKNLIESDKDDDAIKKSLEDYQKQSADTENEESIKQAEANLRKAQESATEKSKEEIEKVLKEGDVKGEQNKKGSESKADDSRDSDQKPSGDSNSLEEDNSHSGEND